MNDRTRGFPVFICIILMIIFVIYCISIKLNNLMYFPVWWPRAVNLNQATKLHFTVLVENTDGRPVNTNISVLIGLSMD